MLAALAIIVLFSVGNLAKDLVLASMELLLAILANPEPRINVFQRWLVRRAWKQTASLHDPIALEVTESEMSFAMANASAQMNWRAFIRCIETPHLFLLYQSPQLFNLVPKRAFANTEQLEEFRSLLKIGIRNFLKIPQ